MASSRPRARTGASASSGCGPSLPARATRPGRCSASRAPCAPSPRTRSMTTWRSSRSPARRAVPSRQLWSAALALVPMADSPETLVGRLFNAFNQRDVSELVGLCSPRMEFFAITAEEVGRGAPYVGPDGLRAYLEDVERFWEELLI